MINITGDEFARAVKLDPDWADSLTEPVRVIDFCNLSNTGLRRLSRFLTFSGRNDSGAVANFSKCTELQNAAGTFEGSVSFHHSGIYECHELVVNRNEKGPVANMAYCRRLREASGHFAGRVNFDESGITRIHNLVVEGKDMLGVAGTFRNCQRLLVAEGTFPGMVDFSESNIEKIGDLIVTDYDHTKRSASFQQCMKLKVAEGKFPGSVDFHQCGIEKIGKLTCNGARFYRCENIKFVDPFAFEKSVDWEFGETQHAKVAIGLRAEARKALNAKNQTLEI